MSRLHDKVAFITGAGSGLGRECAVLFAEEGAAVVVTDVQDHRAEDVATLVEQRGGSALAITMDVRNERAVESAFGSAMERYGRVDVVLANAGVASRGYGKIPVEDMTERDWDDVHDVNLKGVFFTCKHAARIMKGRGRGSIIVTSSAAAEQAYPGWSVYGAAKGGVNSLVRHLASEWGVYGIRVNAICPTHGMSANFMLPATAAVSGLSHEESQGRWDPSRSPIPLKLPRPPRLRDNALPALFLASDESEYMTGLCVPTADGGTLSRVKIPFIEDWEVLAGTDADKSRNGGEARTGAAP